jgi:hypothetical protein
MLKKKKKKKKLKVSNGEEKGGAVCIGISAILLKM